MPLIRRWKALPFVVQLAVLLCLCLVVIGGLVIGLVALSSAQTAGREAKGAVNCVNTTLGERNQTAAKDAAAHISFAAADKAYDSALVTVLVSPKGPGQLAAYKAFVLAAQEKRTADLAYVKQLRDDQRYRANHPLGQC